MKNKIVTVALTGLLTLGGAVATPSIMFAETAATTQDEARIGFVKDGVVTDVDENGDPVLSAQATRRTRGYSVKFYGNYNGVYRPYTNAIDWETYLREAKNAAAYLLMTGDGVAVHNLVDGACGRLDAYRYNDAWTFERNCRAVDDILYGLRRDISPYRDASWWTDDYYWYDCYLDRDYWGYGYNYDYWYRNRDRRHRRDWDGTNRYYTSNSDNESASSTEETYRLSKDGDHVYTTSKVEREALIKNGWTSEGTAWQSSKSSKKPVYELVNAAGNKHMYTSNKTERDSLVAAGWKDEGTAFYASDKGVAVYRLSNAVADHFFTTSTSERDALVSSGWTFEGVAFNVAKK